MGPPMESCPFPEPSFTHRLDPPPQKKSKKGLKQSHTFLSKSQVKEPLSLFPQQGPCGERCSLFRAIGLFIHSYFSESLVKELSHERGGKHMVTTIHGAPRGWRAYIQWGVAWFPKGIVCDTAVTPKCHAAFSTLPSTLGRPEPC